MPAYDPLQYFQTAFEASTPVLKKKGWSDELLQTCRQKVAEEVETGYPKFSYKVVSAWAVKK